MEYILNPTKKPSITELLDLLNKPALLKWANKIGLEGVGLDEYRNKSRKAGTSLHKQIELFVKSGTPFEDVAFQERFVEFFSDKEIIEIEKSFETEGYVGRMDIKFNYGGIIYVADFKSNQSCVYLENKLQLAAYRAACGGGRVAVISIPEMKMIDVPILDFSPYERFIELLVSIYNLKKTL